MEQRREAAKAYLDGQLSRRVFLRRMVALGMALPVAAAYADLLKADPAQAQTSDYYVHVTDFYYSPDPMTVSGLAKTVEFGFDPFITSSHSATDPTKVISSGFKGPGNVYTATMSYAGTFKYRCKESTHPPMTGTIRVPMSANPTGGPPGTYIELSWSQFSGGSFHFDVQRKRPSETTWQDWILDTPLRGTAITPQAVGWHRYRSRARNTVNGKVSGWSPVLAIQIA